MSLLMDALKKAEQDKREAAKRMEDAADRALTPELETAGDAEITGELEMVPPEEVVTDPPPIPDLPNLSLEPIGGDLRSPEPSLEFEPAPPPEEVTLQMELPPAPMAEAAPIAPPPAIPATARGDRSIDPDMTFHGLSATDRNEVPGLYEPTVQGEPLEAAEPGRSYDETLPGVSALQLAKDIGPADQPTPAAAETVFAARGPRGPSAALKWTMIGLTGAAVAAASVGYYVIVTPMTTKLPDPWVARGIESVPPPAQPLQPVTQATAPAETPASGPGAESPVAVATPPQMEPQPAAGSTDTGTSATEPESGTGAATTEVAAEAEAPAAVETPVAEATIEAAPPAEAPARAVASGTVSPRFESDPPPIQITRSSGPPEHARLLREAYASFQSGDFNAARLQYLAVLNDVPDNVDALLGMGAIAMKENDTLRMAEYFTRVLRLDPRNKLASAALIRLRGGKASGSESAIKSLINEQPDSPFLYFSLGNVYAGQGRWPEAQQAFFDAYRLDSGNPDYALNLAASLDRIGQREAALDYYRVALRLSEERPAGFDPAPILERIEALNAAIP